MDAPATQPLPFGDYLVYVDESGDHELTKIDPQYPVFVLLFCIIRKDDYLARICPDLQRFKFEFWGHDEVVLHEHEIRKPHGHFLFLLQRPLRERFLARLNQIMIELPATVVAVVIDKPALVARYQTPVGPYDYAMEIGLERVFKELEGVGQSAKTTPVIVECRGRKEDRELELAFRRVCDGANALRRQLPFSLAMVPKAANSAGLQLTDLMARPVGLKHLRPDQPNRAYDIIAAKFRRSPSGKIEGWGLKRLP
jgi:hypothetical protein